MSNPWVDILKTIGMVVGGVIAFGVFAIVFILLIAFGIRFWEVWRVWLRHSHSTQPVYGWRMWNVGSDTTGYLVEPVDISKSIVLRGVNGAVWSTPNLEAECRYGHPAPKVGCTCGIYSLKVSDKLFNELEHTIGAPYQVWGRVAMSGNVVEHEDGYRSSRAEIVEFAMVFTDVGSVSIPIYPRVMARLRSFGVPVSEYEYADFVNELRIGASIG